MGSSGAEFFKTKLPILPASRKISNLSATGANDVINSASSSLQDSYARAFVTVWYVTNDGKTAFGNDPSRGRHAMDATCDPGNLMTSDNGFVKTHFTAGATTNITNHPTTINCLYMGGHVKTLDNKRLQTNTLSIIASMTLLDDRSAVE